MLTGLPKIRPPTVRRFFALANQHMRWHLYDLAHRLDERPDTASLAESGRQHHLGPQPGRATHTGGDRRPTPGTPDAPGTDSGSDTVAVAWPFNANAVVLSPPVIVPLRTGSGLN
jgi:hypothetical protein